MSKRTALAALACIALNVPVCILIEISSINRIIREALVLNIDSASVFVPVALLAMRFVGALATVLIAVAPFMIVTRRWSFRAWYAPILRALPFILIPLVLVGFVAIPHPQPRSTSASLRCYGPHR